MSRTPTPELIERAWRLASCHVSDAMDRLGLPSGVLVGLRGLEPVIPMAGVALTVRLRPIGEAPAVPTNYLEHIGEGDVVVIDAGGRPDCSVWGGNRSLTALRRGGVGAVLDGAYRDVAEHRGLRFPVYGLAPVPAAGSVRLACTEIGGRVSLRGVEVARGDLVVADESGVVVVPEQDAAAVVEVAEGIAEGDAEMLRAIAMRAETGEVLPPHTPSH